MSIIKDQDVIQIVKNMLNTIDHRLVDHGERVTFLCIQIMKALHAPKEDILMTSKLALFHDIGAYKTDEIDEMFSFETKNVWDHAIYGYLFLSHMSPLKEYADCVLYHHLPYTKLEKLPCSNRKTAALLNLCDRIDVANQQGIILDEAFFQTQSYLPHQVSAFLQLNTHNALIGSLNNGEYYKEIQSLFHKLHFTDQERKQYLEMLAYSIDFNSEFTVLHTIMTTSLAMEFGKLLHLDALAMEKLYYGTLLHDIGKGAIPTSILEKRGTLTKEEMEIMKLHVSITEAILKGYIDPDIERIASRHHEKLDGSGYPYGLQAQDLSQCERIVAVADILSALLGKRSYKDEFPIEKVLEIVSQLAKAGKLDQKLISIFILHHYEMMTQVTKQTNKIKETYDKMTKEYEQIATYFHK